MRVGVIVKHFFAVLHFEQSIEGLSLWKNTAIKYYPSCYVACKSPSTMVNREEGQWKVVSTPLGSGSSEAIKAFESQIPQKQMRVVIWPGHLE